MNIEQTDFYTQAILSMAALVGLTSFLMLGQGRLLRLIFVFGLQGFLLTMTTALAAYSLDNPHLYISAVLFGIFFFHIRTSIDSLDVDLLNRLHEVDK